MSGTRIDFLTAAGGFGTSDFFVKDAVYWGSWAEPGTNKPVEWKLNKTANTYSLLATLIQGSGPPR